jgi:stress response protein YsnF
VPFADFPSVHSQHDSKAKNQQQPLDEDKDKIAVVTKYDSRDNRIYRIIGLLTVARASKAAKTDKM